MSTTSKFQMNQSGKEHEFDVASCAYRMESYCMLRSRICHCYYIFFILSSRNLDRLDHCSHTVPLRFTFSDKALKANRLNQQYRCPYRSCVSNNSAALLIPSWAS
ncbi:hypothetical protein V6N12_045021 [Hibiscus sabdariffa]|uniref:Uncharacterized protein n=1 Tax=Hibiscus sabdariffa TaxID=183260 RepID=A0ABR2G222_9ROSI